MLVLEASRTGFELHPLLVQIVDTDGFFGKPFWWGLVGAVIGGLIGIAGQFLAFREQRRQKEQDRVNAEKAQARSVLFKLLRIQNTAFRSLTLIESQLSEGERAGVKQRWAAVRPITNWISPVHFSTEELVIVSILNDRQIEKHFLGLDDGHEAIRAVWSQYGAARRELAAKCAPDRFEGELGTTFMASDEYRKLLPQIIELNSLVDQALELSRSVHAASMLSLNKLIEGFNKRYGSSTTLESLDPEPAPQSGNNGG